MKITERDIKIWSSIGSRATFGIAALELAKVHKDLIVITSDVSTSAGLDRFRKTLPNQYIDVGIAEQNMMGIAAGLASEDFKVITTTFTPFQTARCCEQIKINLGYMENKVCMVGLASGLALGTLGYSHCSIEDIGMLRSIPNINIISPADGLETVKSIQAALTSQNSCYIRLTGVANNKIIYNKDYDFKIGKSVKLKDGNDITIFCNGAIIDECLKASDLFGEKGLSCKVINMHTIKPIDEEAILNSLNSKLIITVEEHNVIGGLSSAVSETKSKFSKSPPQIVFGVNDKYSKAGDYEYLKIKHGLNAENIVTTALKKINS
tara:strand:- start:122 stop:1087 length:966 start_codon:yes stop_codon:yes gene_type:complete